MFWKNTEQKCEQNYAFLHLKDFYFTIVLN